MCSSISCLCLGDPRGWDITVMPVGGTSHKIKDKWSLTRMRSVIESTGCDKMRLKIKYCHFTRTPKRYGETVQNHRRRQTYPRNKVSRYQLGLCADIVEETRKLKVEFWKKLEGKRRFYSTGGVNTAYKTLKKRYFRGCFGKMNYNIVLGVKFCAKIDHSARLET